MSNFLVVVLFVELCIKGQETQIAVEISKEFFFLKRALSAKISYHPKHFEARVHLSNSLITEESHDSFTSII